MARPQAMISVIGRAVFIAPPPNSPTGTPASCWAVSDTRVTGLALAGDVLAGLVPAARAARDDHRDVLDAVDLGVAGVGERQHHACCRASVPSPSLMASISTRKSPKRLHDQARQLGGRRLVAELGVGRLVVGVLVIDLGIAGDIGFRRARRVHEVEHLGLIAGQAHGQQAWPSPCCWR